MEQRLIDANSIKLEKGFFEKIDNVPKFYEWLGKQPTVDAVQVTRCRDCKYWSHNTQFCSKWSNGFVAHRTPYDYYCADGERKDDE